MERSSRFAQAEAARILLVALRPEEEDAVARHLAALEATATLRAVSGAEEARSAARAAGLRGVVCSFKAFAALAGELPDLLGADSSLPALVLVPAGSESQAAPLLKREGTDVLLQAGDYRPLLLAWVRRVLSRREPSWAEVGRIVRHEINNPLTGVLGQSQLLLREDLNEKARKRAETIENMAIRIRDVVAQLRLVQRQPRAGNDAEREPE